MCPEIFYQFCCGSAESGILIYAELDGIMYNYVNYVTYTIHKCIRWWLYVPIAVYMVWGLLGLYGPEGQRVSELGAGDCSIGVG